MRGFSFVLALFGIFLGIIGLFGATTNFEACAGGILMVALSMLLWAVLGRNRAH